MENDAINIEQVETELLLEAIYRVRGYDFRHYAKASLARRLRIQLNRYGLTRMSELIPLLLYDSSAFDSFLKDMSITVTDMFRDPFFFKKLRETVFPYLNTWPYFKIWCAGCATGEEVYSLAIMLMEENLYDRARIYATDYNKKSLAVAEEGIYPLERVKQFTNNYNSCGGKGSLADYYVARYDRIKMNHSLKKKIVFAHHNLVADAVFGEMNLVLCRNVLIYFDRQLQDRVLKLFYDSLGSGCFLCLGTKESICFSSVENYFEPIAVKEKIFRKKYTGTMNSLSS